MLGLGTVEEVGGGGLARASEEEVIGFGQRRRREEVGAMARLPAQRIGCTAIVITINATLPTVLPLHSLQHHHHHVLEKRLSHGKNSWPELVGVNGDKAVTIIEKENPNVGAKIVVIGRDPMTKDFYYGLTTMALLD
ncbi:hypothetical protein ZIOFF_039408 [Zingiber officinale]|uniref:Uncharacterized protein n=1 Tax=Zingiber officinale TaxID=94328 RepID=A0A8J5GBI9_ZINOF|nr:hypothetical protein ZIOFF_039408 [Zingiber officinale]